MTRIWMVALVAAVASPVWAACPPDCPYRLGFETTLTLDDGNVQREERLTFSRDFDARDILGSSGSIRLGLSTPFFIGDPLQGKAALDVALLWSPSTAFSPAALQLRTPLTRLQDLLNSDPGEGERPTLRLILPRPIRWDWAPQPFIGGGNRGVEAGLIFNFLSVAGTPVDATNFMVDRVRVDYRISAVPEPQSWALWISGLSVAGVALRRRQRKLVSA